MKNNNIKRQGIVAFLVLCLMAPQFLFAASGSGVDEDPPAAAMAADLIVARPIGLVMTVAGTAVFLVSLPFTILSGSVGEAADTLVVGPAETTFVRCLGCKEPGYTGKDIESLEAEDE